MWFNWSMTENQPQDQLAASRAAIEDGARQLYKTQDKVALQLLVQQARLALLWAERDELNAPAIPDSSLARLAAKITERVDADRGVAKAVMVQCAVRARNTDGNWEDVRTLRRAGLVADRVLGEGRKVEATSHECVWLVEFTQEEWETLEGQGYIDLEKDSYEIVAEMP